MKEIMRRFFTGCLLILLCSTGYAELAFLERVIEPNFDGAWIIDAVDLDQDGDIDVLASGYESDQIGWWENDGEAFIEHIIADQYDGACWVQAVDLDNDDDLDIVTTAFLGNMCTWWENDGDQVFTEHTIDDLDGAFGCDVVDMDGDDDLDILLGGFDSNTIKWWENDGTNNFNESNVISDSAMGVDVGLHGVDLDGDEDIDVVATARDGDKLVWFENDGEQVYTEHIISDSLINARWGYTVDLDEDDDLDILAAGFIEDEINLYLNDGAQNFTETTIMEEFNGAICIKTADMDDDGDLDIVACARLAGSIRWLENDGNENFAQHVIENELTGVYNFEIIDMDGDEDLDIVAAGLLADQIRLYENVGNAPEPFDLYSPEDGSILEQHVVPVTWFSSSDIDPGDTLIYEVEWSLDGSFPEEETYSGLTEDTTYVIEDLAALLRENDHEIDDLPENSTIYWRVKVIDSNGAGAWSTAGNTGWTFMVSTPDPPGPFNLLLPPDGDNLELLRVAFNWTESLDPDPDNTPRYDVWLDVNPDLSSAFQIADSVDTTNYYYINLDWASEYYWTVRATDNNTEGTWASDTFHFSTPLNDVDDLFNSMVPTKYSIESAHPNPFNQTLSVVIGLPQPSELKVRIYNILGEEVNMLTDQAHSQGYHTFVFEAAGLSTGIYFIQANVSGKWSDVRKVVLMK